LKMWMEDNTNFKENYTKIKQEILNNPEVKDFLSRHEELTAKVIDKNLIKLHEYTNQSKQCQQCTSFQNCKNMLKGYSPILYVKNNEIHLSYEKCPNRMMYEKQEEQQKLIESLYVPKEILEASMGGIDGDPKRGGAVRDRKSTRLNSSHVSISYAVFCLKQ